MTALELRTYFNETYGISHEWPATFEVDRETYANVCQFVFTKKLNEDESIFWDNTENGKKKSDFFVAKISIGEHGGIMFKNVELILSAGATTPEENK